MPESMQGKPAPGRDARIDAVVGRKLWFGEVRDPQAGDIVVQGRRGGLDTCASTQRKCTPIVTDLPLEFLRCRAFGHRWEEFVPVGKRKPEFGFPFSLLCTTCVTERHDVVDTNGQTAAREYLYPDGYQLAIPTDRAVTATPRDLLVPASSSLVFARATCPCAASSDRRRQPCPRV